MQALPKKHKYNLYLKKETPYIMVFENKRRYSIIVGTLISLIFWATYITVIVPIPDTFAFKEALTMFFLFGGGMSLLALLYFAKAYESLTLRKINRSIHYEYHSFQGLSGWKKRFEDFHYVQIYQDRQYDDNGNKLKIKPAWHFDLIGIGDVRININPDSPAPIPAKNYEEAVAFAEKIAIFMGIQVEVLANEDMQPNESNNKD